MAEAAVTRRSAASIPFALFKGNITYFVDALPIVGLQYALALRFRNFMVPLGIGMAIWFLAIGALHVLPAPAYVFALGYFLVFTVAGYWVYATKSDKGLIATEAQRRRAECMNRRAGAQENPRGPTRFAFPPPDLLGSSWHFLVVARPRVVWRSS